MVLVSKILSSVDILIAHFIIVKLGGDIWLHIM